MSSDGSRGRSRSRYRSESFNRSNSRNFSRSRSPGFQARSKSKSFSRSQSPRFSKFDNEKELSKFRELLKEQENHLSDLMLDHKKDVEDLVKERKRSFRRKPLQKQFEFLDDISNNLEKTKKLLKKNKVEKALKTIRNCSDKLEDKKEDLLIADQSPHGWLAVSLLRENSDLPRGTQKKLDKINYRLDRVRSERGNQRKNYGRYNQRC